MKINRKVSGSEHDFLHTKHQHSGTTPQSLAPFITLTKEVHTSCNAIKNKQQTTT